MTDLEQALVYYDGNKNVPYADTVYNALKKVQKYPSYRYTVIWGSGLAWCRSYSFTSQDELNGQEITDILIDKLDNGDNEGLFIEPDKSEEYNEDQYVVGGNRCRALLHYGTFNICRRICIRINNDAF